MTSELEVLQRIENPTLDELKRISLLRRYNRGVKIKKCKTRLPAPPISEQLDKIKELCGGKKK